MRRPPLIAFAALLVLAAAFCGAAARPATAVTYYPPWAQGTMGNPFSLLRPVSSAVSVQGTDDQSLQLAHEPLGMILPSALMWDGLSFPSNKGRPDPRMVYPLPGGHLLICGGKDCAYVKEVDASGSVVFWEYKATADSPLGSPFSAEPARFDGKDCILISDRDTYRVFAVTKDDAKDVVWQYGTTGTHGLGVNQLTDPFCATQIAPTRGQTNGNVLIADSKGANRVIEIKADEYNAAEPDMGYKAESIAWQYGVAGVAGSAPGHLNQARSPQRLPNGDTLITDALGQRIIEVKSSDYNRADPDNHGYKPSSIVWSYENGVDGAVLDDPNSARYIASGALAGKIVVADAGSTPAVGQCVKILDPASDSKTPVETFDLRTYAGRPSYVDGSDRSAPRDAQVAPDGSLWIADAGYARILRIGNQDSGTVISDYLDCGKPGVVKAFERIKVEAPERPAGTGLSLWYNVDHKGWKWLPLSTDGKNYNFPGDPVGKLVAYKVMLTSKRDHWATPVLDSLSISSYKPTTGGDKPGPGGTKPGGSGNNGGSGEYSYPPSAASGAVSGTGTSGTGTGAGTSGYGSGSGSYGAGSGSSGAGAGSSSAANSIEVPVQSTGGDSAQAVQGYQVQGEEGVSGVPLRAAEGSQVPEPERPGPVVPVLALVAAGLVVAAAFFIPWPFVASHMRHITGFDHTRPARFLPFRPLGK